MIEGVVNSALEATLVLTLIGPMGRTREIEAVVDTGFSEILTLPSELATESGLDHIDVHEMILADGIVTTFDVFDVRVMWSGQVRDIEAHASAGDSLVGMAMLKGHRLTVDVVEDGKVLIESPA